MKKWALLYLAALIAVSLTANPIVVYVDDEGDFTTYLDRKESVDCIAVVGSESSIVSCEVGYRLRQTKGSAPAKYLHVAVPAFTRAGENLTNEQLLAICRPTVEIAGVKYEPDAEVARESESAFPREFGSRHDAEIVWFRFLLPIGQNRRLAKIQINYVQPTISGRFLYLPLFEDRSKSTDFYLQAIGGHADNYLSSPDASGDFKSPSLRLRVPMRHEETIEVKIERKA